MYGHVSGLYLPNGAVGKRSMPVEDLVNQLMNQGESCSIIATKINVFSLPVIPVSRGRGYPFGW